MKSIGQFVKPSAGVKEAYQELLMDSDIQALLNQHDIDMKQLPRFVSDLNEYVIQKSACQNCKGLAYCKQPVKGHFPKLEPKNKQLKLTYEPCHFELNQRHLANIKSFHMPLDYVKANFDAFILDPERFEAHEKAIMFIHDYLTTGYAKGLYLYGAFGTGKTYLLSAIANELSKQGKVCGMVYFPELIAEIKAGFNQEGGGAYHKIEQLKTIDVLMIDDIGSESMTSWMRDEVLGRILNYRMHQNLPTFFTSNFDYDGLQHHYSHTQKGEVEAIKGARVIERVKALTVPVKMTGTNYRHKS